MKKFLLVLALFSSLSLQIKAQSAQQFVLKNENIALKSIKNDSKFYLNLTDFISLNEVGEAPFLAISIRINGVSREQVKSVSLKYKNKNSTEFELLDIKPAHDNDDDENYISELIFLKNTVSSISFEIQSTSLINFDVNNLKLRAFYPSKELESNKSSQIQFRGTDDCSLPKLVSRNIWGASYGLSDSKQYKNDPAYADVTHLIVHHGSSPNVASNWAAVVASYFDYHVNTNGWSDIGYNYLVAPDGTIFVGRGGGDNVIGAHYCGKNTHTMGVCMIGTYNDVLPTDTALQSLVKILAWKAKKEKINPNGAALLGGGSIISNIDGHRSGCATDCPGEMVWNYLPTLRERVVKAVNVCVSTPVIEALSTSFKITPSFVNSNILTGIGVFKTDTHWQISDVSGKVYKSGNILADVENFRTGIENLGVGVYFLTFRNQFSVNTEKFIKLE